MKDKIIEFLDEWKGFFGISLSGTILLALLIYGAIKWDEYQCKEKAEIQELEYLWGIPEGCMVKDKKGKWIDYNKYRVIE